MSDQYRADHDHNRTVASWSLFGSIKRSGSLCRFCSANKPCPLIEVCCLCDKLPLCGSGTLCESPFDSSILRNDSQNQWLPDYRLSVKSSAKVTMEVSWLFSFFLAEDVGLVIADPLRGWANNGLQLLLTPTVNSAGGRHSQAAQYLLVCQSLAATTSSAATISSTTPGRA